MRVTQDHAASRGCKAEALEFGVYDAFSMGRGGGCRGGVGTACYNHLTLPTNSEVSIQAFAVPL